MAKAVHLMASRKQRGWGRGRGEEEGERKGGEREGERVSKYQNVSPNIFNFLHI